MKVSPMLRMSATLGLIALLLCSCASLPLPDTPEKSLLVIHTDVSIEMTNRGPLLTGMTLVLNRLGDGKVFSVPVSLTKNLTCFAIDPGSYSISSLVITRTWVDGGRYYDSWKENHGLGYRLLIEPQTVLLYPSLLNYADKADTNQGYTFDFYKWQTPEARAQALADMKKDTHWLAWEGYTLVNFSEE